VSETIQAETVEAILAETGGWASISASDERLTITLSQGTKIHVLPTPLDGGDAAALLYELEPKR
jgi:hypothetical protein